MQGKIEKNFLRFLVLFSVFNLTSLTISSVLSQAFSQTKVFVTSGYLFVRNPLKEYTSSKTALFAQQKLTIGREWSAYDAGTGVFYGKTRVIDVVLSETENCDQKDSSIFSLDNINLPDSEKPIIFLRATGKLPKKLKINKVSLNQIPKSAKQQIISDYSQYIGEKYAGINSFDKVNHSTIDLDSDGVPEIIEVVGLRDIVRGSYAFYVNQDSQWIRKYKNECSGE